MKGRTLKTGLLHLIYPTHECNRNSTKILLYKKNTNKKVGRSPFMKLKKLEIGEPSVTEYRKENFNIG